MMPAVRHVVLNPSLETRVKNLLRRSGGSLYVPSPTNCFQGSAGTTPCTVDSPVGYLRDLTGTNHATQVTAGLKPILRGKVKNYLLNSATLSTQNVTSSAVAYTLHFTGTGTVTLSGTSTAGPLAGTGASDRVSLTFTPTAGTLTLTVSGSVTNAQLELGATANEYIPTTSAAASSSYGPYWLDFDGVDDRLIIDNDYSPNKFAYWIQQRIDAGDGILFADGATRYIGAYAPSSGLHVNSVLRTPSIKIDGILFSGTTRAHLHDALQSGIKSVINIDNVDVSDGATTIILMGQYKGSGSMMTGAGYCWALGNGPITESNTSMINKYLAKLTGISI